MKGGRLIFGTGVALFGFMLAALVMMSEILQDSERFGDYYSLLLVVSALGLLVLIVLIGINLRSLIVQLRQRAPGIRLTVRMVAMISVLAVTPVLILYYFSLTFLHRGIDNWFDLRVEEALDDSLELSQLALELRRKEIVRQAMQMADELAETTNAAIPFEIDEYRTRLGAEELMVLTRQGGFIASSVGDTSSIVPDRPDEAILFQVQQGTSYVGLDTVGGMGLSIRAVVGVPQSAVEPEPRILQALFPFSGRFNELAGSVETAFLKYQELSYLREQLKYSFILVLTLVLLFSVFTAVWAAFYSARALASPIRDLAQGTQAVAAGDYSTQLPVPGRDELGFLVASFNEMTRRIAVARDAARLSQQHAEEQSTFLEAILSRLSSGVLVIDGDRTVRTANISGGHILGTAIASIENRSLAEITSLYPYLEPVMQLIDSRLNREAGDWREQVTLFGTSGRQILMCSGTSLPVPGQPAGMVHVIVFDDITALIQGQRNAAWGEMARRLAHEIKNPLTPIQLAAERLRQKYLGSMDAGQADTLNRLTNTIIQQVETMKDMVNTFSDYARPPVIAPEYVNLNQLVREVIDLYANLDPGAEIRLDLARELPSTMVDPGRIRQVLNNLLKNAFEASAGRDRTALKASTSHVMETGLEFIEIRIRDSGPGIPEDIISTIFEPYVTTKQKGTGLGLAIVKKIIDEHNGLVWMENNRDGCGACAVIRLPVIAGEHAAGARAVNESRSAV